VFWELEFYEPIPLPRREPLVTLRDAAITSPYRRKRSVPQIIWRPAAVLLNLIGENGGCVVLARFRGRLKT
jgi:hypothetical protein